MDEIDALTIDFRSLPAAKKHIDATYRLAHEMLRRMQQVGFHRTEWVSFGSTIAIPCLDESDEVDYERFKVEEQRLYDVRVNCAKQLEDLLESLAPMKRELQKHVNPLIDMLDTILPSTLGTISLPGISLSGRFAFFFFYSLSVGVEDWGRQYSRIVRSSYRDMMFGELRKIVETANEAFPFTDAINSTLYTRLNEERSLLLLRLKDYREIVIDLEGETKVGTNDDVEKIMQDALLASLSQSQKSYVFCGRIWSEYRREQNALISAGKRKKTREGVQIVESFPTATTKGWPKDQLDEFIKHAKEGIKNEKPWTDFVKGSKGEKIPLEKFLT